MTQESEPITKDAVLRAEQKGAVSHPILDVLEQNFPRLQTLRQECAQINGGGAQQDFIAQNYGFLADAIVEAGHFTLEPLEVVAVWSRVREIFGGSGKFENDYHRFALAGIITTAFAIQGLDNPAYKAVPRYFLENSRLPEELVADEKSLVRINERVEELERSIKRLAFYVSGKGDGRDTRTSGEIIAVEKERTTPTLACINEDFGNGMMSLRLQLKIISTPIQTPSQPLNNNPQI